MVRKKDVEFYCGFSRKELQSLCKKYSLPANRSSSDMAESLASYFEKNSLNSVGFGVGGIQGSSGTTSRGPVSRTWDVKRDSYGNELNITREDCFRSTVARGPGFILGNSTQSQERNGGGLKSNEKGPMDPRLENRMKEVDNGGSPSSSSFEFHVSMEEGISLSVDLNFNPSDWINSMTNEVNVYDSMRPRRSPPSDLGVVDDATKCKKQKSSGQDKDGDVRRESSTSPARNENTQVPSDHHHSNGELCLAPSAIQPCKAKNGVDSSGPGQIVSSCVESCSKSCCVNPVDLECVDPPGKKLTSDSVMVAPEQQSHPADDHLLVEIPQSFRKVGNSSTVICPRGAGSELSSSEAEAYPSNALCSSPRKTSRSSNISSSELIIDRESTSYSESFKFRYNGEEQEKSEVFSEQARSE
ncbi:hypothetical protein Rs2_22978 [Raphanus sativus]|uniref:Uncharacterized protein LOC108857462 n=1 Tax=Raphanus sativus TaxID=3726 RepID=A0A6J0NQB1_RAPSA|nr:uncharacterized protein LOC108857462 [Raphanus sativus]XP_018486953.1 uncharacterized protein LOC108857462 [Raphanus sativus]KAJ4896184.1 hypothetical protein Rs2_22978 [Raphanus sativus]